MLIQTWFQECAIPGLATILSVLRHFPSLTKRAVFVYRPLNTCAIIVCYHYDTLIVSDLGSCGNRIDLNFFSPQLDIVKCKPLALYQFPFLPPLPSLFLEPSLYLSLSLSLLAKRWTGALAKMNQWVRYGTL
ncbi:unnamed protein product [Choristocarpus tenellus]